MKRFFPLLALVAPFAAHSALVVTVIDLNDTSTEVFASNGTGVVSITTGTSSIFDKYWQTYGLVSITNEGTEIADGAALLGTSSFALNALEIGANVSVDVRADYDLGIEGPGTVTSQANAATLTDASVAFNTGFNDVLLDSFTFTNTGQNYFGAFNVDLTSPFVLNQEFVFAASAIGADVGFDVSTGAVPEPGVLAMLGLGLIGMVGMRKLRKQ